MKRYKTIDLFAGIGGIRLGFEQAFGEMSETVFVSEWDIHAQKTYNANFGDSVIAGDITQISENDVPSFDICLAGFPCQAFSLAGQRKGFGDDYRGMARGTLFFDVVRICEKHKPSVIFCENVKGLTIHDNGRTFDIIKKSLEEIGYTVYEKILNSRDFGVPQNRERIYVVAFRNDINSIGFRFPDPSDNTKRIKDIIEEKPVSAKYYLSETYIKTLRKHRERHEAKGNGFGYEIRDWDDIAGAIVCGGMGRERNLLIDKRQTDLTPVTHIKGEINKEGIRKMTPREWARLQGYPDTYQLSLADVHLYKQLGNSVSVPVIKAIAKKIKIVLERNEKKEGDKMAVTMNRGEWSEAYAFLRLLAEGKLFAADENLNRIENMFFPIRKIIRKETQDQSREYRTDATIIKVFFNETEMLSLPASDFCQAADELLDSIRSVTSKSRSFSAESSETFFANIGITQLKAPSNVKTDIKMEIHDVYTGIDRIVGFSIKSDLGAPPTLFNASNATNFVYEISGLNASDVQNINGIDSKNKIIDRMSEIVRCGGSLSFARVNNSVFEENLVMIDSQMHIVIDKMLDGYYFHGISRCSELARYVAECNPLSRSETFYTHKIKEFLCAIALGMKAATLWDGRDEANGGYVIAKTDGDIVAYHIYNRDFFKDYLLRNTKLERGSTTKHNFATIYRDENTGRYMINLNLQIRFI